MKIYRDILRNCKMFPVRCFSCNKVIGDKRERYNSQIAAAVKTVKVSGGFDDKWVIKEEELAAITCQVMNSMGLKRYCCRSIFLGHVDLMDKLLKYE
jgi:DNA-directed RNA polymerase subunit N (RpoN/RPB10)